MTTTMSPLDASPDASAQAALETGPYSWVATVDHKRIGILYLLTSLFFFAVGGVEALFLRLQLSRPDSHFLSPAVYNQIFTMHGTTMIFLVVMPTLVGLGNYLLPLMIGARDMAFPRLNALSYWLFPFGGLLLHFSAAVRAEGPGHGEVGSAFRAIGVHGATAPFSARQVRSGRGGARVRGSSRRDQPAQDRLRVKL